MSRHVGVSAIQQRPGIRQIMLSFSLPRNEEWCVPVDIWSKNDSNVAANPTLQFRSSWIKDGGKRFTRGMQQSAACLDRSDKTTGVRSITGHATDLRKWEIFSHDEDAMETNRIHREMSKRIHKPIESNGFTPGPKHHPSRLHLAKLQGWRTDDRNQGVEFEGWRTVWSSWGRRRARAPGAGRQICRRAWGADLGGADQEVRKGAGIICQAFVVGPERWERNSTHVSTSRARLLQWNWALSSHESAQLSVAVTSALHRTLARWIYPVRQTSISAKKKKFSLYLPFRCGLLLVLQTLM